MTGRQRIQLAMSHQISDRVPVMCQLSIGHYLLNVDVRPHELWFSSEAFCGAVVELARRYRFDGILVNLPGHPERWDKEISEVKTNPDGSEDVVWQNGESTHFPPDDNPHHDYGSRRRPAIEDVDPELLFYDDPHVPCGLKYPYSFRCSQFDETPAGEFPPYFCRILDLVRNEVKDELSVHSEVFSPFTQFLEFFGYQDALMNLLDQPEKCHAILASYARGTVELAALHAAHDVDAVLMSSAFAGGGFVSRGQYEEFVLPYEREVVTGAKQAGAPFVYTHTCGAIGDRLDLMAATGIDGIDTLDPPPLGTVDLEAAKSEWGDALFFKGNIDSVNTLLNGSLDQVKLDAASRVKIGMPGGGYILSSACSVAPRVAPEKLMALADVAEEFGRYR